MLRRAAVREVLLVLSGLVRLPAAHRLVVTVEDTSRAGGVGSARAQARRDAGVGTATTALSIHHGFLPQGTHAGLLRTTGLDAQGIVQRVLRVRAGALLVNESERLWSSP